MPATQTSIDWAGSLVLSWRLRVMDTATWEPGDDLPGAVSAEISRDAHGALLESGNAVLHVDKSFEPAETWARFEVLAKQGAAVERWPIATMLLVPSEPETLRGYKRVSYDAYSVLKAAQDVGLPTGYSVRAGVDGAAKAAEILQAAMPVPVRAVGSFTLSQGLVLSRGTTRLEAAWKLVDAAGWCIQVQPDGTVEIKPKPDEPALIIDKSTCGLLGTSVQAGESAANPPNTYIAVDGLLTARATLGSGRPVEVYDDAPKKVNGESLQAYAERRLAELNEITGTRSYERAWMPGLTVFDLIEGKLPEAGMEGPMRIATQRMTLSRGWMISEESEVLA